MLAVMTMTWGYKRWYDWGGGFGYRLEILSLERHEKRMMIIRATYVGIFIMYLTINTFTRGRESA